MYGVYVWVTDVVPTWVVFLLTVRWQGRKPHRFTSRDFRTYRYVFVLSNVPPIRSGKAAALGYLKRLTVV